MNRSEFVIEKCNKLNKRIFELESNQSKNK
jgi:hypothetical protein